jgi:uncharacterized protein (DUF2235 family)
MKRLVLLFDGTWNDDTGRAGLTNIVALRQRIEVANRKSATGAIKQRIFYDEGVGTAPGERLTGGALGTGLGENVRQGYRFLSQFYEQNGESTDEVYIFGFSRGGFTARSLAGFVAASGLLRRDLCDRTNLDRAWGYYRTPVKHRLPAEKAALEKLCHPAVQIHFLGVFDTVGALGIPIGMGRNQFGSHAQFHDTKLGSQVRVAVQAMALDERRGPFVPALWAFPDHNNNEWVEQVWFPGVHSDIGGGYRESGNDTPMSAVVLDWMIRRIGKHTDLDIDRGRDLRPQDISVQTLHDSRGWYVGSRLRPMVRLVDATPLEPADRRNVRTFALNPPDQSMHERVHVSALQLWGREIAVGRRKVPYRPVNLRAALDRIRSGQLKVIGYDAEEMAMADVLKLLPAA